MSTRRSRRRPEQIFSTFAYVVAGAAAIVAIAWATRYQPPVYHHIPPSIQSGVPTTSTPTPSAASASTTSPSAPLHTSSTPTQSFPEATTTSTNNTTNNTTTNTTTAAATPYDSAPSTADTGAPPVITTSAPAMTAAESAVAQCLQNNGVTQSAAYADATNPSAQGAMLDACRLNPTNPATYQQCMKNNGETSSDAGVVAACMANPNFIQSITILTGNGGAETYVGPAAATLGQCPPTLQGTVVGSRVALTLGLPTANGYKAEPAIVDSGSPSTYVLGPQVSGTTLVYTGALSSALFPFFDNARYSVPTKLYRGTLAVLDGATWQSIGVQNIEVLGKSPGPGVKDALGINAFNDAHLTLQGTSWSITFPC